MGLQPIPETHAALIVRDSATEQGKKSLWATAKWLGENVWGTQLGNDYKRGSNLCPFFGTFNPAKGGWFIPPVKPGINRAVPTTGPQGGEYLALALPPTMEEPKMDLQAQSDPVRVLFAPRPGVVARQPSEVRVTLRFTLDSILSLQGLGNQIQKRWGGTGNDKDWIKHYLILLETLGTSIGGYGRRPYLALYWAGQVLGGGGVGFVLEGIDTEIEWTAWRRILSAQVTVSLTQYLVW